MSSEASASIDWMQTVLEGPTGLELNEDVGTAEDEQLVVAMARSEVIMTPQGVRIWEDLRFTVKGIVANDLARANEIARQIDDALARQINKPTTYGCVVYHCVGEGSIRYAEQENGRTFYHRGRNYWLKTRKEG